MKKSASYLQLIPYLRPQLSIIISAIVCTLIFTAFWPILAWLAGQMANYIGQGNIAAIAQLAGISAVVFLVRGTAQYGQDALMAKAALKIALQLRKIVYQHLQKLSLDYFAQAKTGDLAYRLTEDIDRIGEVIDKLFHDFLPCILQLIVVLSYMIYLNWQLTVAALIITPLIAVIIGFFGEKLLKFAYRSQEKIANLSALLSEVLGGIRLIQAFGAEEYEVNRFMLEAKQNYQAKYTAEKVKAFQFVVVGFLQAMSIIFLFFLGGWQIAQKNLTGSEFISYVTAVAMLIDPVGHITSNFNEFKQGEASVERVFNLLTIKPQIVDKPGAIKLAQVKGKVEYKNVYFSYGKGENILENLSFIAKPGETIALVGASGAGKSTIVNLLFRFYEVEQGEILIDDVNIKDITLKSLREKISIVPQENILFSGTIAQNIALGKTQFALEKVEEAAKIANAHEFIVNLSQGYHTYVGERGVNLSGGQRQRIAIARAVFSNPKILILDEATSALDSESEMLVQKALEKIIQQRTVFVIAHRLATVRRATRILIIEKGKIIEVGNHQQLLKNNGRYAKFYSQQFNS